MDEGEKYQPDSLDVTPGRAAQEAIADIERWRGQPRGEPTKALFLFLWDEEGGYDTQFLNAGMKASEIVALLEIMKAQFVKSIIEPQD